MADKSESWLRRVSEGLVVSLTTLLLGLYMGRSLERKSIQDSFRHDISKIQLSKSAEVWESIHRYETVVMEWRSKALSQAALPSFLKMTGPDYKSGFETSMAAAEKAKQEFVDCWLRNRLYVNRGESARLRRYYASLLALEDHERRSFRDQSRDTFSEELTQGIARELPMIGIQDLQEYVLKQFEDGT